MPKHPSLRIRNHLEIDLADFGLPEIPVVGIHNQRRAGGGLPAHIHEGLLEICYLASGERVYSVDRKDYRFRGNELFVTYPDELHGSGRNPHGKGLLYWMQVRPPTRGCAFLGLSGKEAAPLGRALQRLPRRSFRGDRRLARLFEAIFEAARAPVHPLTKLSLATRTLEWLLEVVECARRAEERRVAPDIRAALDLIAVDPAGWPRVDALADAAHLSASRFKAKFKEQIGIPPAEYLLRRKIELAERLLADKRRSVTDIAYDLGFSSSQYFATAFRRFTNHSPRDLRRA